MIGYFLLTVAAIGMIYAVIEFRACQKIAKEERRQKILAKNRKTKLGE